MNDYGYSRNDTSREITAIREEKLSTYHVALYEIHKEWTRIETKLLRGQALD
jgi:hypothetical protein